MFRRREIILHGTIIVDMLSKPTGYTPKVNSNVNHGLRVMRESVIGPWVDKCTNYSGAGCL